MSRPLLLLAASGLAREVAEAARAAEREVFGVLDDKPALHGKQCGGLPVIGPISLAVERTEDLVVCVGSGAVRRGVVKRLAGLGVGSDRYASVLHPSVSVPGNLRIGSGTVLLANSVATADVLVGAHVVAMPGVVLTHDCVLDDYATLAAGVLLGGGVHVGEAAYLGMGATVRPRVGVGAGAVVGMGAVVLHDVPPSQTWAGVPARPLEVR